jgi:hypothetical protein
MRINLLFRLLVFLALLTLVTGCGGGGTSPSLSTGADVATTSDSSTPEEAGGTCVPECNGRECGDSGCPGYSCGYCGAGMYCDELFQCGVGICTPDKGKCIEGGLSVCAKDGLSWLDPVPCEAGETCQDNECFAEGLTCDEGDTRCFDGGVQECDAKGAWLDAVPCPESKICADGQCVDEGTQICEPGDKRCSGDDAYETCKKDGTAWSNPAACPAGASCDDGICLAGPQSCATVLQCMLQGNCGDFEASCFEGCFEGVSAEVAGQAMAFYECVFGYCEKWGPSEPCFQTQQITGCAMELADCKDTEPCQPKCAGKQCGGDGCGGSCGSCSGGQTCDQGQCVGGGGCNGISFEGCCNGNVLTWCENNNIKEQDCAWDPQCGWNSQQGFYDCDTMGFESPNEDLPKNCSGTCTPNCAGKQCGGDGCGGICGLCPEGQNCQNGACSGGCTPSCANKECGNDGCGGSCGGCPPGEACENHVCKGGTNEKGCANVAMCALACNFDESCLNTCWNKGDSQAKQLFQNLLSCVGQVCGMWVSEDCLWDAIEGPCAQDYQTCMDD